MQLYSVFIEEEDKVELVQICTLTILVLCKVFSLGEETVFCGSWLLQMALHRTNLKVKVLDTVCVQDVWVQQRCSLPFSRL